MVTDDGIPSVGNVCRRERRVIVTMHNLDLPPGDRFAWWSEQVARDTAPCAYRSPHTADFRATVTLAELGPVRLSVLAFPQVSATRTPALIRRSDPEHYGLSLIRVNPLWIGQRDRYSKVNAGDLLLHDTSQPYEAHAQPGASLGKMLMLHFPRTALPLRPARLECLLAQRLAADGGMNAILASYLTSLASALERNQVSELEARRLGTVALDLATAALATLSGDQDQLPPETRQQALLSQIEAFIEHNLHDPALTPATIAARHHISVGYLHLLFQPRELTVAAWIRHLRLEHCRADLCDPRLQSRPIHAIGARWGFPRPADFSRTFRTAYGTPPGDYRRQTLAASRNPAAMK
jgi:AraC-like DNA-binding protein